MLKGAVQKPHELHDQSKGSVSALTASFQVSAIGDGQSVIKLPKPPAPVYFRPRKMFSPKKQVSYLVFLGSFKMPNS